MENLVVRRCTYHGLLLHKMSILSLTTLCQVRTAKFTRLQITESYIVSLFDIRKIFKFCGVSARPISGVLFFQPLFIIKYNKGKMHDKGSTFKPRTRSKPGVHFDAELHTHRFWCFQKRRSKGVNLIVWRTFIEQNSVTCFFFFFYHVLPDFRRLL